MPVILEKIEEIKKESSEIFENVKEVIEESVQNIDINNDNLPLSDNSIGLLIAVAIAIIILAKPLYGPILLLIRIGIILALGYFALIFLALS